MAEGGRAAKAAVSVAPLAAPTAPIAAWTALAVLALVNAVNYMDRWVMSVLIEPIKRDLHLSDTQMGLLTGLAFSLSYALFAIPIARWADRGHRRTVLIAAISLWSVMTGFSGLARNFWELLLARVGVGAGEAGCIPTGQALISDLFPQELRAFALAMFSAGSMLGKVIGIGGAGFMVVRFGWRDTLMALAVPGLLVALLVRLVVPPATAGTVTPAAPAAALVGAVKALLGTRSYVLISLALAASNLVIFGVQSWSPAFYMRTYGLSAAQVGAAVATVVGVGSAIGLLAGGYIAQRLMRRDPRWAPGLGAATHLVVGACSVGVFAVSRPDLSLLLFAATSIIANLPTGAIFATQQNVTAPQTRALAAAISLALVSIIGLGVGPVLVGALSDALTPRLGAQALRTALMSIACLNLAPAVLYALAARALPADLVRPRPGALPALAPQD